MKRGEGMTVSIDGVVACPGCGCEETALVFRDGFRASLVCGGCVRHWLVTITAASEIEHEAGPHYPTDAQ